MTYRELTSQEISKLEAQGCHCDSWAQVKVAQKFNTEHIANVTFSGNVQLGAFEKMLTLPSGTQKHSGIYNARIHNCEIRNNVYISNIHSEISNYLVDENATIENVGSIYTEGFSSFGNGLKINTMNESGSCSVPIYNELTAQIAYAIALGKSSLQTIQALEKMVEDYAKKQSSNKGYIGKNVTITDCNVIRNMKVGDGALINGALKLSNGTVNSSVEAPSVIESGVIAEDFITTNSNRISDGAVIRSCFVGQGVHLGQQFSAEHSLFFANSECLNGEVCAIFAGPYTVTHHKSTLLIAGMFSFYNAGSGTNQSNHMYKLGPIHQGLLERGCKTGSNAYLLFPARVGAFSVVLGSHQDNINTSTLPFSYIIERDGVSALMPGMNLRNIGVWRDLQKWPNRDKRRSHKKLDLINFELFTPYTIGKISQATEVLKQLQAKPHNADTLAYNGVRISRSAIIRGMQYYEAALKIYMYNAMVDNILNNKLSVSENLKTLDNTGKGDWVDMAGMVAPQSEVKCLFEDIAKGMVSSLEQVAQRFDQMHNSYAKYAWVWTTDLTSKYLGKKLEAIEKEDIIKLIAEGSKAEEDRYKALLSETGKEVALASKIDFDIFPSSKGLQASAVEQAIREQAAQQKQRAEMALAKLRE